MNFVAIAIGSVVGGELRSVIALYSKIPKPWTVLIINVVGSFLLGIIVALYNINKISRLWLHGLGLGFCGIIIIIASIIFIVIIIMMFTIIIFIIIIINRYHQGRLQPLVLTLLTTFIFL